jgi:hypothetical protein
MAPAMTTEVIQRTSKDTEQPLFQTSTFITSIVPSLVWRECFGWRWAISKRQAQLSADAIGRDKLGIVNNLF